jgi:hypothetical protein
MARNTAGSPNSRSALVVAALIAALMPVPPYPRAIRWYSASEVAGSSTQSV